MKNAPSIVVAGLLAALVGTSALAQSKSREEVRAEAASAAKAGQIDHGEVTTVPPTPSTKARPDVKAETRAAVKAGQIDHGEVTTTPPVPKTSKTRAEVKAEAASAIKGRGALAHTGRRCADEAEGGRRGAVRAEVVKSVRDARSRRA
jgi:hypothetical protein